MTWVAHFNRKIITKLVDPNGRYSRWPHTRIHSHTNTHAHIPQAYAQTHLTHSLSALYCCHRFAGPRSHRIHALFGVVSGQLAAHNQWNYRTVNGYFVCFFFITFIIMTIILLYLLLLMFYVFRVFPVNFFSFFLANAFRRCLKNK